MMQTKSRSHIGRRYLLGLRQSTLKVSPRSSLTLPVIGFGYDRDGDNLSHLAQRWDNLS
jgi:hypothetical protein